MSTQYIDQHLAIFAPLKLSLNLESFYLADDKPGVHEILGVAVSVLTGGRTLAKACAGAGAAGVGEGRAAGQARAQTRTGVAFGSAQVRDGPHG